MVTIVGDSVIHQNTNLCHHKVLNNGFAQSPKYLTRPSFPISSCKITLYSTMTLYHCPFCPFGDDDSEYLVQHVSLVHPENDDSTFFVNNHREQSSKSIEGIREGPDSRQTTSGENYIECECGETVLLSDFSSHSDLHLAEGMAFGEIEKVQLGHGTTILSRDQSPCHDPGTSVSDGPLNTSSSSNGDLSNDSTSSLRPQTSVQKHPYSVKDWANVLFGTGPPPRPKTKKTRRKGAKRLGVRPFRS